MSLFNFKRKDGQEKKDLGTTETQRVAEMARQCLSTDTFKAYRERYEALEQEIIAELIKDARMFSADQTSLEKFGAKCLVRLTRLYDVRSLLVSVTNDERKDKGAQNAGHND